MTIKVLKTRVLTTLHQLDILREVSCYVSKKHHKCRFFIMLDMIYSLFHYGCYFTEYQAFDWVSRTKQNRKTFVTVGWILEQFEKYNPLEYRSAFHDKRKFDEIFSDCLNRDWIAIKGIGITPPPPCINNFLEKHNKVVLKKSYGCSGKQVYVSKAEDTPASITKMIEEEGYDLIEESISNIEVVKNLNPTSLNTIRIVTIRSAEYFKVICACLRIGAIESSVDNVSCGGTSARINIDTHRLETVFCANDYRKVAGSQIGRNEIGLEVPYWDELIALVKNASLRIPQIHIVGWDVAITENGPCLIEGNESFHTDVMQFYASPTEPGIKARFEEALTHIKN